MYLGVPLKKVLIVFFLVALFILISAVAYRYKDHFLQKSSVSVSESGTYVRFDMEAFDKISQYYWAKTSIGDLATLFELSVKKTASTTAELATKDRAGTLKMLSDVFVAATSTDVLKHQALDTLILALANIQPVGRNQLLVSSAVTELRNNVENINPAIDLYENLGTKKGASAEEIEKAFEEKKNSLKNASTSQDKAELEKIVYAHKVLSNVDTKTLYDDKKIEPTTFTKILGNTLYINMTKISPTTLQEFGKAILATPKGTNSLIIDLRGNIGGSLDFVQAFLGLFLGQNQYVFDLYSKDIYQPQRTIFPKAVELAPYDEIAILTDEMTQSSAEVIIAAFKRFRLGVVIGKKTRGWGTVENTYPLETEISPDEKFSLLLVNSITLRDDNQPIEGRGVDPDIDVSKNNWRQLLGNHFKSASIIKAIKQAQAHPPIR